MRHSGCPVHFLRAAVASWQWLYSTVSHRSRERGTINRRTCKKISPPNRYAQDNTNRGTRRCKVVGVAPPSCPGCVKCRPNLVLVSLAHKKCSRHGMRILPDPPSRLTANFHRASIINNTTIDTDDRSRSGWARNEKQHKNTKCSGGRPTIALGSSRNHVVPAAIVDCYTTLTEEMSM